MTLNMNQFTQTPLKGALDALVNPTVFSVQLDPASEAVDLVAGAYVKLVSADGNQIIVDLCDNDEVGFGYILFSPKKDKFNAGDTFEVAAMSSVLYLEAGAAIARGAQLQIVQSGAKVITNAGNPVSGLALDEAAASGDLIRVFVLNPYSIPATITSGSINGVAIGGSNPSTAVFTDLKATGVIELTGSLKGASPLIFEGATADAFEGTLAVPDFTADRTFTLPDAGGNIDIHAAAAIVITPGATPAYAPGANGDLATLTPGEDETIAATTTGAIIGKTYRIEVVTSGTTSRTITFGSNFKSTGTLATGTVSGKTFVVSFVFDGTNFVEVGRTTAM